MATGLAAKGTLLKRGDGGSPESFVTVANITSHNYSLSADQIDVTSHSSSGSFKQYVPGLKDSTYTADVNFDSNDTSHKLLMDDFLNDTESNFQLIFPNGDMVEFTATVTQFDLGMVIADKQTAKLTLSNAGAVTLPS